MPLILTLTPPWWPHKKPTICIKSQGNLQQTPLQLSRHQVNTALQSWPRLKLVSVKMFMTNENTHKRFYSEKTSNEHQHRLQVFLQLFFIYVTYCPVLQKPFLPQIGQSENEEGKNVEKRQNPLSTFIGVLAILVWSWAAGLASFPAVDIHILGIPLALSSVSPHLQSR